jgi:hypothetical protein
MARLKLWIDSYPMKFHFYNTKNYLLFVAIGVMMRIEPTLMLCWNFIQLDTKKPNHTRQLGYCLFYIKAKIYFTS